VLRSVQSERACRSSVGALGVRPMQASAGPLAEVRFHPRVRGGPAVEQPWKLYAAVVRHLDQTALIGKRIENDPTVGVY